MKKQKTYYAVPSDIKRDWFSVDAEGQTLGRLASNIASVLRGKHKPSYTPSMDTGDFVVVTNVEKLTVTGNKVKDKKYYFHSRYPGGLKTFSFEGLQQRDARRVLYLAVKGMLPHNRLGRKMLTKLKLYVGSNHPHTAQNPKSLEI